MRLDKLLSQLGIASRSGCRELLRAGRVRVDGLCPKGGDHPVQRGAKVTLDGAEIDIRLQRHVMLYKPAGVLTAREDRYSPTVMDLLPKTYDSLGCMPVGRLDKDVTGLLLLTTDGELNHRLLSPARHVDKVYLARVEGILDERDAAAFAAGIPLNDFTALPSKLEILDQSLGRLTIREGKYHQVKRMFGSLGKPVKELKRVAFGPLALDENLAPGEYRELTEKEASALYGAAGMADE